jgi:hypothetical protein
VITTRSTKLQSAKRKNKNAKRILLPWRRKDSRGTGKKAARWNKKISNNDPPPNLFYILFLSVDIIIETINQAMS